MLLPLLLLLPLPEEGACTDEVELVETAAAEVEVTVVTVELEVLEEVEVAVLLLADPELAVMLLPLWHCCAVAHWHCEAELQVGEPPFPQGTCL